MKDDRDRRDDDRDNANGDDRKGTNMMDIDVFEETRWI